MMFSVQEEWQKMKMYFSCRLKGENSQRYRPKLFWNLTLVLLFIIVFFEESIFVKSVRTETTYYQAIAVRQFNSYGSLQVFEYPVHHMALATTWMFHASPETDQNCIPAQVIIHIQHGSYPIFGTREQYPKDYYLQRTSLQNVTMLTNDSVAVHRVLTPLAGSWYGVAYLTTRQDHVVHTVIESKACHYRLQFNISTVYRDDIVDVDLKKSHKLQLTDYVTTYRFFQNGNIWKYSLAISECWLNNTDLPVCPVELRVRSGALPDGHQESHSVDCSLIKDNKQCKLTVLGPDINQWQYLYCIKLVKRGDLSLRIKYEKKVFGDKQTSVVLDHHHHHSNNNNTRDQDTSMTSRRQSRHQPLPDTWHNASTRVHNQTKPIGDHTLRYNHSLSRSRPQISRDRLYQQIFHLHRIEEPGSPFVVGYSRGIVSLENLLELASSRPSIVAFDVYPNIDSGGTLNFEASVTHMLHRFQAVVVNICITRNVIPLNGGHLHCTESNKISLDTREEQLSSVDRYFPYPEPGRWFLGFQATCYGDNTTTNASGEGPSEACMQPYPVVLFRVLSTSCDDSNCGDNGKCEIHYRGVHVYSSCTCYAGWRGYQCTDSTHTKPKGVELTYTLLLALSNLCFLPAIILTLKRKLFVEAFVYFANMFFSTFYHGCDMQPWSTYVWCLMPYHVLSYCDFYASIMSIWTTMMAMARPPAWLHTLALMVGAYALAMGVEWNVHGLWHNVVPVLVGIVCICISWWVRCRVKPRRYPNKLRVFSVIVGVVMVAVGFSLYIFIETDDNYPWSHSIWHACMSLSIIFLLPSKGNLMKGGNQRNYLKYSELMMVLDDSNSASNEDSTEDDDLLDIEQNSELSNSRLVLSNDDDDELITDSHHPTSIEENSHLSNTRLVLSNDDDDELLTHCQPPPKSSHSIENGGTALTSRSTCLTTLPYSNRQDDDDESLLDL